MEMGKKYTIVILGTTFGISYFRDMLYKRFPYDICGTPTHKNDRFEMQVQFSKFVIDEKLRQFFESTHPYAKVGACCCEESEPM